METSVSWVADRGEAGVLCYVSTDDPALIRRCLKGIEEHKEECRVIALPEDNDGCLYFSCPVSFGKRSVRGLFPSKKQLTEEQREAARERLRAYHEQKEKQSAE